jgi:SAM-dependent methyltransferase
MPLGEATFYEFGAGQDLVNALTFYMNGVSHQVLVDREDLVRPELVSETARRVDVILLRGDAKRRGGPLPEMRFPEALRRRYGIDYFPRRDAGDTGLDSESVDCITSTNTLEHIPETDIDRILRECHRLLKPNGLMSHRIDYQDHYAAVDPSISAYNFLSYSDRYWAAFCPSMLYQNRLRHSDYLNHFRRTGFAIVRERRQEGSDEDIAAITQLPLSTRFRQYRPEDLAVRAAVIVAQRA